MNIPAGDLLEIAVNHSELGDKIFEPKSGEDHNIMIGGFKSVDDEGNFTSARQRIDVKNAYPWSIEPTIGAYIGDIDFLQALSNSTQEGDWTFTFIDGSVRVGSGMVVGDLVENRQAGTIPFKIQGSGTLDLI